MGNRQLSFVNNMERPRIPYVVEMCKLLFIYGRGSGDGMNAVGGVVEVPPINKDIVQLFLGLEDLLRSAGDVGVQILQPVNVCHIHVELREGVRVDVWTEDLIG